ncbi:hypothetical protein HFN_0523 [Helicobacter fennelliae MRY12-0050]|uniref:Uncharacterized protein n=1 Tax=Helicobacter fennelliae MRY12-0050 TaxID=1325130 RepID=T1DWG5_9HELI|nr:hypothetical protein HFN_0523 [Helicobacter fennelliae MRY12-0050]
MNAIFANLMANITLNQNSLQSRLKIYKVMEICKFGAISRN